MQIFKEKSYSDTRKNFLEKNFGNFLRNFLDFENFFDLDSIYGWRGLLDFHPPLVMGIGLLPRALGECPV